MKLKSILLLSSAMVIGTASFAQQRTVLYEEFTGENCGPCAAANPGLETLMAANTTKIIHVTYMENIPAHTPHNFYLSAQSYNDARINYYNPYWSILTYEFTPSGMMDGFFPDSSGSGSSFSCGNVSDFAQADIDNEYAKTSPFKITATHYFNTAHDSVFGKVVVKAVSAIGGSQLKLRTTYVKSMDFATAPGTNGERHFENVARTMFPSTSGQPIASSWAVNDSNIYTYKGKITGLESTLTGVTILDSNLVVWIQNDSAGAAAASCYRVQQAAKSSYVPHSTAGISLAAIKMTDIEIAPNPAANYINVRGSLSAPVATRLTITNAVGQVVAEKEYTAGGTMFSENISLSKLSNGIYFMNITNDGATTTKKFVVSK